ncbi:DUF2917 domain-containing protein [Ideonella sp.]|uniref:DUF2917 domain-containing protein n=1 Tax=Ideonella sp. TaxID=1929293 RepID=UPI002B4A3781|nr:DUF2917 domain-containing protein [Ideonella sp.]HJV71416.1 DUF2917 domain-containing protein [Ideonella sp.]
MNHLLPTPLERPLHLALGRVLPLCPLAPGADHLRYDPRRLRWWPGAPVGGITLQVLRGAVWLTWPGCEDDLFLHAGQALQLPPPHWGSAFGVVDGVLVETEPRLSPAPAVVRLVAIQTLAPNTTARARPWRLAS